MTNCKCNFVKRLFGHRCDVVDALNLVKVANNALLQVWETALEQKIKLNNAERIVTQMRNDLQLVGGYDDGFKYGIIGLPATTIRKYIEALEGALGAKQS